MTYFSNETLAIAFLVLAFALTFLMFYLWGFPFDHESHRSAAPRSLVNLHRLMGYLYLAIYVALMWDMVPRLWSYQVELPARTVAHLVIGMAIGALLLTKIAVVRFFKHLEAKLVPHLGTALFVCTILLMGLALPTVLREAFLREAALMGDTFTDERLERVRTQLPKAGLEDDELLARLATSDGLLLGRSVLVNKCTQCHDLRTVLVRPRTPESWRQTVERMSNRSTILNPITDEEQWLVTAYLVAITPTLQRTTRMQRQAAMKAAESQTAVRDAVSRRQTDAPAVDLEQAKAAFEQRCSQCHSPLLVEASPPRTAEAVSALVTRMVRNGLVADDAELAQIIGYLEATYAQPAAESPAPAPDAAAAAQPAAGVPAGPADVTLEVAPRGNELAFADTDLTVKTGQTVRLVLDNTGSGGQTHSLVLVRDAGAVDEVADEALGAAALGFLPEHEAVLSGIPATDSGARGETFFQAPAPGDYTYLCTMPGHSFTMRGTLHVTE